MPRSPARAPRFVSLCPKPDDTSSDSEDSSSEGGTDSCKDPVCSDDSSDSASGMGSSSPAADTSQGTDGGDSVGGGLPSGEAAGQEGVPFSLPPWLSAPLALLWPSRQTPPAAAAGQGGCAATQLLIKSVRADFDKESGMLFLSCVSAAASCLGSHMVSRSYRLEFSVAYRALFSMDDRDYRMDVFEATRDRAFGVSGQIFRMGLQCSRYADDLQASWSRLCSFLRRSDAAERAVELRVLLDEFDAAWVNFERLCIPEYMAMEQQVRDVVQVAIDLEKQMQLLHPLTDSRVERRLVAQIAVLNSVANREGHGRDDLDYSIVEAARAELRSPVTASRAVARFLASEVVESYNALRNYLRFVDTCMVRLDPHLYNNPGFVAHLVDWEESWQVCARYARSKHLLDALCATVTELKVVQTLVPELTAMVEERAPELFLTVPRLLVLLLLLEPSAERRCLFQLFSDRFDPCCTDLFQYSFQDPELRRLHNILLGAIADLSKGVVVEGSGDSDIARRPKLVVWEAVARLAVLGEDVELMPLATELRPQLAALVRGAGCVGMGLQRRQSKDWNHFMALLVGFLEGCRPRDRTFQGI